MKFSHRENNNNKKKQSVFETDSESKSAHPQISDDESQISDDEPVLDTDTQQFDIIKSDSSDDEASLDELLNKLHPKKPKHVSTPNEVPNQVPKIRLKIQPVLIDQTQIDLTKLDMNMDNSYTIASFDIGIKNLAYCILSYHPKLPKGSQFKIYDWQVIDLLSEDTKKQFCHKCHLTGNYYQYIPEQSQNVFYCLRHAKLVDPGLKAELDPIILKKHRRVDNTNNLELNIEVIRALDQHPILTQCQEVIMEQQPHKNSKMKNLSFMIFSYFVCRGRVDKPDPILKNIKFISSKHKLNVYDGPSIPCKLKAQYGRNKFYGKAYCQYMIRHDPDKLRLFETHKKQDDLADSYLQGAWYLKHKFDPLLKKATTKSKKAPKEIEEPEDPEEPEEPEEHEEHEDPEDPEDPEDQEDPEPPCTKIKKPTKKTLKPKVAIKPKVV